MPKQDILKLNKPEDLVRELSSTEIRAVNDEDRTVEVSFSSEYAEGSRWFGIEILDHSPESVRLDRLNDGGAVLWVHDTSDQVGVVVSARIDKDKVGRAVIKFSRSARGEDFFNDVKDGIITKISVRYKIHAYEFTEGEGDKPDVYRVTDWEPQEVSFVSIPFDPSVGVGRSADSEDKLIPKTEVSSMDPKIKEPKAEGERKVETPAFDPAAERSRIRTEEQKRTNAIREMSEIHDVEELGRQAISEGWSLEEFNRDALAKVGERNNKARAESKHDGEVDLSRKDQNQFSLGRLMAAIAEPTNVGAQKRAAFELEVSNAAVEGFGGTFECRGVFVPESLMTMDHAKRALTVGSATQGGALLATDLLAGSFIDVLRNNSLALRAGARTLSGLVGDVAIPRQTSGAAATWISAEDGDATNSEPAFDQVTLSPKDLACYTEITRRTLQQSTPAMDGLVQSDLAMAIALGLDTGVFYGTGATGQPTGIANQTGINVLDLALADPTYAELINMIKQVMGANALMGMPKFCIDPNGWEALSTTPKQGSGVEGNFIMPDNTIKGYEALMSSQILAEDYFFGNFSDVLIGEWGGMEMNVDPYTSSLKGRVRYVVFKTADVAVRHPESFCYANNAIIP